MATVNVMNARLAFPHLFEAQASQDGKPKFNANFIFAPDSATSKELEAAVQAVAVEKWGPKSAAVLEKLRKEGRICFHPYAKTNSNGEVYDGFADMFHLTGSNDSRPLVVDRDKTPLTQSDGRPYAGCFVNAGIDLWAQDNAYGKRINATLRWVQFVKDGNSFTGAAPASVDEIPTLEAAPDEEFA